MAWKLLSWFLRLFRDDARPPLPVAEVRRFGHFLVLKVGYFYVVMEDGGDGERCGTFLTFWDAVDDAIRRDTEQSRKGNAG